MPLQEIIAQIKARNEAGMEALLQHYGPLMRYIIAPILPSPRDREDCLQEAAMQVWEKIGSFDPQKGSWNAWLTALTRNLALNRARSLRRHDTQDIPPDTPSPAPTPEENLLLQERQAALARAIAKLSAAERTIFYRKYYYLQPTRQIAAELGISERAVEGKLYRIKKRLRSLLGGEGYA